MMRKLFALISTLLLSVSAIAAGEKNAAPFNLEIGAASLEQVKRVIGGVAPLRDAGINAYTNGPMLQADGAKMEIEGLNSMQFIFDRSNVLVGLLLTMSKDPKGIYKTLSAKYKTISNRIDPFMNYGIARLGKGESIIEIDAPHLSFEMEVRYLTKEFLASYSAATRADGESKKQKKANAL